MKNNFKESSLSKIAKNYKNFPPEHAYEAVQNKYYIEGVAILHAYIESMMRSILHAYSTFVIGHTDEDVWDINEKFDFKNLSDIAFVLKLIEKKDYDELKALNSLRNEMIHKSFSDPFAKNYFGVSKKKFNSIFKPAYNLAWMLTEKNEELYNSKGKTFKVK